MSKLIGIVKTLRRHWKKSVFGFTALGYGVSYGIKKYKTFQLMRAYCEEARIYGQQPLSTRVHPRHVTVILNPVANNRKAKFMYEKYAEPLLHLAGIKVSLVLTENEGQAKDYMEIIDNTDAVIIAGGNGTLHEAITGLLRRPEYQNDATWKMPVGIFPVGSTNSLAKVIFNPFKEDIAQWLAEAAMAVIRETVISIDALKIEVENERPLFALSGFEFGPFPMVESLLSKYWYFGPLKDKVAYMSGSLKSQHKPQEVIVDYVSPCDGCSRCFHLYRPIRRENERWWTKFLPRKTNYNEVPFKDYSKIVNEQCGTWNSQNQYFSNILIKTSLQNLNASSSDMSTKAFWTNIYPADIGRWNFIKMGLQYRNGKFQDNSVMTVPAREAKLRFNDIEANNNEQSLVRQCFIDTEKYDLQPLHISLLPKHLFVYGMKSS